VGSGVSHTVGTALRADLRRTAGAVLGAEGHERVDVDDAAERTADRYRELSEQADDPFRFHMWPLQILRSTHRITPLE